MIEFLKKKALATSITILLIAILAATTYSTLSSNETFVAGARVRAGSANISVYSDIRCTKALSSIDWGDLKQGDTKNFTFYVKNTGVSKITLSMTTSDWSSPVASQSIAVSWIPKKTTLTSREATQVTISLTVAESASSSVNTFTFKIVVTGKT